MVILLVTQSQWFHLLWFLPETFWSKTASHSSGMWERYHQLLYKKCLSWLTTSCDATYFLCCPAIWGHSCPWYTLVVFTAAFRNHMVLAFAFSPSLPTAKSWLGLMLVSSSACLAVFSWAKCNSYWENFSSAHVLDQIFVQIQDIVKCQKHLCEFLLSGPSCFTLHYCESQLSAIR